MPCYHPIPAHQGGQSKKVTLWPPIGTENLAIPCGKCIGCKQDKATQWAHRCEHEAQQWRHNQFLTLTYDDKHLPGEGLDAPEIQRFLKRLRKRANPDSGTITHDPQHGIRYIACGEYGKKTERAHYHFLLFNCNITDGQQVGQQNGKPLYESTTLNEIWEHGGHRYGTADPGAAGNYIAKYLLKHQGNRKTDCDQDGVYRNPPFLRMSLKPAIGNNWLQKYANDLQHGYLVNNGHRQTIPRTYVEKLKKDDPNLAEVITIRKTELRRTHPRDWEEEQKRIKAAEIIHKRQIELSEKRTL